jgi:hypothetical protein
MLQTSCRYVINSKLCNILVFGRVTGLLRLAFICAPRLCILIYPIQWCPCPNVCDYAVSKCAGIGAKKDWVWPDHSNDHPLPQGHNHPLVSENLVSSFLGMPPGLETSEPDSADIDVQTEFEQRVQRLPVHRDIPRS